jgi:hypothetical protein
VHNNDVDSDDESKHTKVRQVLRRLQSGQYDAYFVGDVYMCPFCKRRLSGNDFNSLVTHAENISSCNPKVGESVNVNAFFAHHKTLGIHVRNLQREAIEEWRVPPIEPKVPKIKGQCNKKWMKRDRE